jgi:hypothetical protein
LIVAGLLLLSTTPALADFLAIEIDAQAGYASFSKIQIQDQDRTLAGGTFGARGKLEILFLSAFVDYQHFFNNGDFMHLGLGADFKLPLSVVEPYVKGSVGMLLLTGEGGAYDPGIVDYEREVLIGFQARAGVGLDIPLGDWFAIGVAGDVGYHYISQSGIDFSVVGYLGLRI